MASALLKGGVPKRVPVFISALLKGGVPKRVPVFISMQVLARMMRGKGAVPNNLVHAYIDANASPGEQELLHAAYNDRSAVLILDGLVSVPSKSDTSLSLDYGFPCI